ncbi:hypothetical protein [Streptomyces halstedii]|uniref:Uncharacterized protein n=1 Tax=Streptomyces halstedii TaxID=1944 RepID=A0A6N9TVV2_STRHA|nr:hypothetical protein [Streptomyces halstedii]
MSLPYFEVNVPMRSTVRTGVRGLHVFTGRADSRSSALRIAHEVYDAARAASEAGREIPHGRPDGWGARGFRPGWELDWTAAKAAPWRSPYSWLNSSSFEL